MRRRIALATIAVLLAAIVAFAVPLAIAVRGLLVTRALDGLQDRVEQVAIIVDDRARTCGQVDLFVAVASQEQPAALALLGPDGRVLRTVAGHQPDVGSEFERALTGVAGRRHGDGFLAAAVPLSTDVCLQQLVLHAQQPDAALQASVRRAWLALAAIGVLVVGVGAAVTRAVAGRVTRPLRDLADTARRLGEGDFTSRAPRTGMPEVDRIAETLDRTAERLGRAVERGRTFAADASHQLRTPLTALRLHLDSLAARGGDDDAVAAALAEADRLEATVEELVVLASLEDGEEEVAVSTLLEPALATTRAAAQRVGRDLEVAHVADPVVRLQPGAVRQAVQVLLDNALQHGTGTIRVTIAPTLPDQPERGTRITVEDEGPGPPPDVLDAAVRARDRGAALPLTGGRGLPLARLLVEGEGGRLVADEVDGRVRLSVVLPRRQGA